MYSRIFLLIAAVCLALPVDFTPVCAQDKATADKAKTATPPAAKTEGEKTEAKKSSDGIATDKAAEEKKPDDKKTEAKSPDAKSTDPAAKKTDSKTDSKDEKKNADSGPPAKYSYTANAPSKPGQLLQDILNQGDYPSPKRPDFPLRARDQLYQKMIHDGYSYAKRLDVNVRIFRDRLLKGKTAELNMEEIAISHVVNITLGRIAEALQLRKEPAGDDLLIHFRQNAAVIGAVAKAISEQPGFPKDKLKIQLDKIQKTFDKAKPKLEKMVEAKQYYPAEQEILALLDSAEFYLVWLPNERQKYVSGFSSIRQKYRGAMLDFEKGEVKKQLLKMLSEIKQVGFDLPVLIAKAVEPLGRGSETTWREKTVTGPQLVDAIRDEWLLLQPRVQKSKAYVVCLQDNSGNVDAGILHETVKNYDKFSVDVVNAVASVVERDLVDCKGDDVAQLYKDYLPSLAAFKAQLGFPTTAFKLDAALDKLAAKDENFEKQVKAYKTITQPILDWRMNLTNEQVAAQSEDMPGVGIAMRNAFREDKKMMGFFRASDNSYFGIIDPVLPTLRRRSGRLINRTVSCAMVITNPAITDRMFALTDEYCYGELPAPKNMSVLKKEIAFLKSDLLVDDKNPPLSLTAALAIWKAENGYWANVGTEVKNFAVESAQAVSVAVPEDQIFFSPLGKLPALGGMGLLLFRYDFGDPYWVRHDYFYCDLGLE